MERKTDVLVLGTGSVGMVSDITAQECYSDKNILLLMNVINGCIPCGIPSIF